jgi:hypothetical protein
MPGSSTAYIGNMGIVSGRCNGRWYVQVRGNSANGIRVQGPVVGNGRDITEELKFGLGLGLGV